MFERNARSFTELEEEIAQAWEDPYVKKFWSDEAEAVISFLAGEFADLEVEHMRELEDKAL